MKEKDLTPAMNELIAAAREFCKKCETGKARSKDSYRKFRNALDRMDLPAKALLTTEIDKITSIDEKDREVMRNHEGDSNSFLQGMLWKSIRINSLLKQGK